MKEWQRWERMAVDFEKVGDTVRTAESLSMALELLPPGHKQEKSDMLVRLERARAVSVEHGVAPVQARRTDQGRGKETTVVGLGMEHAREAVLEAARALCGDLDGARESEVVAMAAQELDAEEDLVMEALDELVDEGLLYRPRKGRVMRDGMVEEADVGEAILAAIAELSTGGRGASRADVVEHATSGGLGRGAVLEALVDLEDAGRLEEDQHGQLKLAIGAEQIEQVHGQVLACVRDAQDGGKGMLRSAVVRDLTDRGWELQEVEEAIEELEVSGGLVIDGPILHVEGPGGPREDTEERVLAIAAELAQEGGGPLRPSDLIRRAGAQGLDPRVVHEAVDSLVDDGALSRDRRGHLRVEAAGVGTSVVVEVVPRSLVLELVKGLQRGHQGASRAEVVDQAQRRGLSEDAAEEALEALLEDGQVHVHGRGFLRPG